MAAQLKKHFGTGLKEGVINGPDNIRQHWNEYKKLRQQAKAGGILEKTTKDSFAGNASCGNCGGPMN